MLNSIIISLHNHTSLSGDDYLRKETPERYIKEAFKQGVNILALTDTNTDIAFEELKKSAIYKFHDLEHGVAIIENKNKESLYLIKGQEFHENQKHIILLGYSGNINFTPNYDLKEVINKTHDFGGIVSLAHPFCHLLGGAGIKISSELSNHVDAYELDPQSTTLLKIYNTTLQEWTEEKNLPLISTADAHRAKDLKMGYFTLNPTLIDFKDGENLINSLKNSIKSNQQTNILNYNLFATIDWLILKRLTSGNPAKHIIDLAKAALPRFQ